MLPAKESLKDLASQVLSKDGKVVLVCHKHKHAYGSKKPFDFSCPDCWMVEYVGLFCNTPQERWDEMLEMLEYSVNHLVEAEKNGTLQQQDFMKHPEVKIESN